MLDLGFHRKQLSLQSLCLLLLLDLEQQSTVDVWQHTTERDGGADESVKLLVATDSELKVARRNTLHLEILGSILGGVSLAPHATSKRGGALTPASSRTSAVKYSRTAVT